MVKLTTKGEELLQKLQAGEIEKLRFTDMALGCGSWSDDELTVNIDTLKDIKLKQPVATKYAERKDDKTFIFLSTTFANIDVAETFYVYEVGLYALDGETEVLYAYDITLAGTPAQAVVQDGSVPQYIPVSLDIGISNIDVVNLTLTADLSVISAEQFRSHTENFNNPHKVTDIAGNAATATQAETIGYKVLSVEKSGDFGYDANFITTPGKYFIVFNVGENYNIMHDGHYAYDYGILYLNVERISLKDPDTGEYSEITTQECLLPFGYWLKAYNIMNRTTGFGENPLEFTDWIEQSISVTKENPLPIAYGGTGAKTAEEARKALDAAAANHGHTGYQPAGNYAAASHGHGLTANEISGVLPITKGGTGNTTGNAAGLWNYNGVDIDRNITDLNSQAVPVVTAGERESGGWLRIHKLKEAIISNHGHNILNELYNHAGNNNTGSYNGPLFEACVTPGLSWNFFENAVNDGGFPSNCCFVLTFKRHAGRAFQLCFDWVTNRRWSRYLHDDTQQGKWGTWREF